MATLAELLKDHCESIPSGTPVLTPAEAEAYLSLVPDWQKVGDGTRIRRRLRFSGFSAAVDFLSRLAPIANAEDHHPDVKLTMYRWMEIDYRTNSIGELSRNDFIMAAKVNQLYASISKPEA
jgi:4a-hydroxytetrahydrobiopterin dehydratase